SMSIILKRRPDVVLGMGGFASFPGGMTTAGLGKPLVIHEQNAVAGLSNRILSRFAARTLVAFPGVLGKKAIHVGNPVRREIASIPSPDARFENREGPLRLLVVGGSRGAKALNETLPAAVSMMIEKPIVLHQTGEAEAEKVRKAYLSSGAKAEVLPFISDMAKAYAECDLVISRSGALTVAEIAAAGVASILVPYPHAVDDHQTGNARYLSDENAAVLIQQKELEASKLADLLKGMDRTRLLEMAERARKLAKPDAAEKVAQICMELAA
ncbi:MAG TPA: undecaprenyldiphospho-muramoylpentapeptide beta-N-acetylglucosaminyltransferase, partial [Burkholderiales bacterium]|nr:undecaprenyldiphospho-muramoylpentapeptide beta-N-acetylglucosaminyltransferase [Burkholderiales bacterium]